MSKDQKGQPIEKRHDFIYLFDVKDGNPNGDPDQGNLPRIDPETNFGLVTDVCMKRKLRNYVGHKYSYSSPFDIFIRERNSYLNEIIKKAGKDLSSRQKQLTEQYYDIRTFGAVLSTGEKGEGAGTLRGPVQFTFARSVDRIYQAEHAITRSAVTTEKEADKQQDREFPSTMGRKYTVPYGLYMMKGFISAADAQKTRFSQDDLDLLWESLINAFEHDRSAARGEMTARCLCSFQHDSALGSARSTDLFSRIRVQKKDDVDVPRSFADYSVTIDKQGLPKGVTLEILLDCGS